jgi:fumarate reductase subunit D
MTRYIVLIMLQLYKEMHMIGHDDIGVKMHIRADCFGILPFFGNNVATFIQVHYAVIDVAK